MGAAWPFATARLYAACDGYLGGGGRTLEDPISASANNDEKQGATACDDYDKTLTTYCFLGSAKCRPDSAGGVERQRRARTERNREMPEDVDRRSRRS